MGSVRKAVAAIGAVCVFFIFSSFPLLAQNQPPAVSLSSEISRLETLAQGTQAAVPAQARHNAFMELARLHRLSGNHLAALRAYEGARALVPDDGQTLLEYSRFLISIGEYQRAAAAINALLSRERERELAIQGRYLGAQLNAFHSGDTRLLTALASDPEFAQHHSALFYTLWRLTGLDRYRTHLVAAFPQSAEAGIAAGRISFAATPLWVLFPGRDSIVLAPASPPPVSAGATPAPAASATPAAASGRFLQAGLFTQEANARAFADQISRAGFQPQITQRQVSGRNHWAVGVNGGSDTNAMIRRLRDAGFEAFPLP
jgi:tetratricopeptide (TPR) repeat protein